MVKSRLVNRNTFAIYFVMKRKNHGKIVSQSQLKYLNHLRKFTTGERAITLDCSANNIASVKNPKTYELSTNTWIRKQKSSIVEKDSSSGEAASGETTSGGVILKLFKNHISLDNRINSKKVFSAYTKSYIDKESEQTLILCLRKLNEFEKNKENVKLSYYIYELQNLRKSKLSYNILKQIKLINNLFNHINENIESASASPSMLLSVAMSYKNIRMNKYTYFKNVLRTICNNIKVYKKNKLSKLLFSGEERKKEQWEDNNYKHTIEIIKSATKHSKSANRVNVLNVYTNLLNNSVLTYVLYAYSTLFSNPNIYTLYICKYILFNATSMNHLDMLCILHFLKKMNVKIRKSDIITCHKKESAVVDGELPKWDQMGQKLDAQIKKKEREKKNCNNKSSSPMRNTHSFTYDDPCVSDGDTTNFVVHNHSDRLRSKNSDDPFNEYRITYLKLLRCIIHLIKKRKVYFFEKPNILIMILYYFYKMNLIPIEIFYKLHNNIKKNIKNFEIKYVCLYLYILSKIQFHIGYYKFIYKFLTNVFQHKEREFQLLSVCMSFYSLSKNEYYYEPFVSLCFDIFKWNAHQLNDVNITNVIYTMGKLKIRDDIVLDKLCNVVSQRIENISAINLSLIVYNLAKVNYDNEEFYALCLEKGKELLPAFTSKQLVIFTYGLILKKIFNYEYMELFFNQFIKINDKCNKKKKQILSTICYSITLEKPDFLKKFPLSVNVFLSKNIDYVQDKKYSKIHEEMVSILNNLHVCRFEILKKKKPYIFDLCISVGLSNTTTSKQMDENIYVDFLSRKKFLRNSQNLNGFQEIKKRHMDLLKVKYFYFDKDLYMSLGSVTQKEKFIENFLKRVCSHKFNKMDETIKWKKDKIVNFLFFSKSLNGSVQEGDITSLASYPLGPNKNEKEEMEISTRASAEMCSRAIKNRDYYIFPSCSKIENVKKNFYKNQPGRVDYEQPLIKRQQIFVDIDNETLLNRNNNNMDPLKNLTDNVTAQDWDSNNNYNSANYNSVNYNALLKKKKNFLFEKKCHGLSKSEYFDEKTGKIVIIRARGGLTY
ncbi:hypothetical protein, conserved [Plasmodium gonderi]|uniref:Uncharacterized protein n=1 Tax=Plasmodium gonderi TaxID=77519 RepID=A0A1Y1JH32_PLAGO|nr:hypothetical protein, conserved [Plasmodium gonderi]GAW81839.1 hypothetical protein, conserved [Plasmodium gonderi]